MYTLPCYCFLLTFCAKGEVSIHAWLSHEHISNRLPAGFHQCGLWLTSEQLDVRWVPNYILLLHHHYSVAGDLKTCIFSHLEQLLHNVSDVCQCLKYFHLLILEVTQQAEAFCLIRRILLWLVVE